MHLSKFAPFLMVPALALGCASSGEDIDENQGAATGEIGLEVTASVGAVVVEGRKVCTAALVDVDAEAKIGNSSASGRQIVIGGACVGRLKNNFSGGAIFVIQENEVTLSTPILSFDFESQAEAGLAVGILTSKPSPTSQPLRILGADATVRAGIKAATVLESDSKGALAAAGVEVSAGAGFNIVTKCTEWHFKAGLSVGVGVGVEIEEDDIDATAIVKIDGELHVAARIDAKCLVQPIVRTAKKIKKETLEAANDLFDSLNQADRGKVIATYRLNTDAQKIHTISVDVPVDAAELLLNGQGSIKAKVNELKEPSEPARSTRYGDEPARTTRAGDANQTCTKGTVFGPCHLPGPFKAGSTVTVEVDTGRDILPDHDGMKFVVSVPKK